MAIPQLRTVGTYTNVMELLIIQEIDRQLAALQNRAPRCLNQVNRIELIAHALNQLPPLYATTQRGLEFQVQRAQAKFAPQITEAVRRSLATLIKDPLRSAAPLQPKTPAALEAVLQKLRTLLNNTNLGWDNLPTAVEAALNQGRTRQRLPQGDQTISLYEATRSMGYRPGHGSSDRSRAFSSCSAQGTPNSGRERPLAAASSQPVSPWDAVYRY